LNEIKKLNGKIEISTMNKMKIRINAFESRNTMVNKKALRMED